MEKVYSDNVSRQVGKEAQRGNILAAKVIADVVKTTLGPKGMDKMLVDSSGEITVTNDGVTILQEMEIEHPVAKMIVEIAKTQESEVGDGTTTAAMLAGKLLERAEILLDKNIHPTVIVKGYRLASEEAIKVLKEISYNIEDIEILKNIAKTSMTGKGAEGSKEYLADLIVKAVEQIGEGKHIEIQDIKIEKLSGQSIKDSELVNGLVLARERANKSMPLKIEDAKILLVDFPIEVKQMEKESRISITSPEQLESFIKSEEGYLKSLVEKIKESGSNVVFCQKGIDDMAQYYFAKSGIFAVRRVEKEDLEKISKAVKGEIISSIEDLDVKTLGKAERVEEVKENGESLIYISGCENPKAVSLILRGGTGHVLDEIERAVLDGFGDVISAVKSGKIVAGGGAVEIELSKRLKAFSKTLGGREQLAVEEFSTALECIPEALAENAGLDPIDILTELKQKHESGQEKEGLNLFTNKVEDTLEAGIVEPVNVKKQAISSASEVAMMILRIDDILISQKSELGRKINTGYEGMD